MRRIVALCGGVGGAKLADGLQQCLAPGELCVIVNTGDDFEHRGLFICPDLDTVLYTLAGVANVHQGWGRENETWEVQSQWRQLGIDTWFQLGDRDIALHVLRGELRGQGMSLTDISRSLSRRFGVPSDILPMCDAPAPTIVLTDGGEMSFQEYFVKHRCGPVARGFRYQLAESCRLGDAVRQALEDPDVEGIVLCPSNPYLSVAPILAVPGLRDALVEARIPIVGVSPLIGGEAVKGPAAKIMRELGLPQNPLHIAREYADFLDAMLIDEADAEWAARRADGDPQLVVAPILMRSSADRRRLAEVCLQTVARLRASD